MIGYFIRRIRKQQPTPADWRRMDRAAFRQGLR